MSPHIGPRSTLLVTVLAVTGAVLAAALGAAPTDGATVETDAAADDLLVQTFDWLETSDYTYTRTIYNGTDETAEPVETNYVAVDSSGRRATIGYVLGERRVPVRYFTDVVEWQNRSSDWEIVRRYEWQPTQFTPGPEADAFAGTNATVTDRTDETVVVTVRDLRSFDPSFGGPETTERWTVQIDAETGTLRTIRKHFDPTGGPSLFVRADFDYGTTVERPAGVPFSVREVFYRLQSMGVVLAALVGVLVLVVLAVVRYRRG